MIQSIFIQNFALIDNLKLDLSKGFTILSGETGTGKSIILDAISLLSGKRSDRGSLFDKSKTCVIEAKVIISISKLEIFKENDIDYLEESIIRREISNSGNNRCFINNNLVSLTLLNKIMSNILEVYSQNYSISLKSEEKQLDLIDKLSRSSEKLYKYQKVFHSYSELKNEISSIKQGSQLTEMEIDFLKYQIKEIESLDLKIDEKDQLESEVNLLQNSNDIISALSNSNNYLSDDNGALSIISKISHELDRLDISSSEIIDIKKRISEVMIELDDVSDSINRINQSIDIDPDVLKDKIDRLDSINSILVKHRKSSVSEILDFLKQMRLKIDSSADFEKIILEKESKLNDLRFKLEKVSNLLTDSRKKIIPSFKIDIESYLSRLGVKDPVINIVLTDKSDFTNTGKDNISFRFSANKGSDAAEIHKVASGGELSRLMLCISYLLSEVDDLSTIIFDEIDAGVSGEIAALMSEMMKNMSKNKQILSVTHLPQIASNGDVHFKVYKDEVSGRTVTRVKELTYDKRIEEIAKMLSGKKVTDISISNAKELLTT